MESPQGLSGSPLQYNTPHEVGSRSAAGRWGRIGRITESIRKGESRLASASAIFCRRSQHLVLLLADWMSAIMIQAVFYGKSQFGAQEKVRINGSTCVFRHVFPFQPFDHPTRPFHPLNVKINSRPLMMSPLIAQRPGRPYPAVVVDMYWYALLLLFAHSVWEDVAGAYYPHIQL